MEGQRVFLNLNLPSSLKVEILQNSAPRFLPLSSSGVFQIIIFFTKVKLKSGKWGDSSLLGRIFYWSKELPEKEEIKIYTRPKCALAIKMLLTRRKQNRPITISNSKGHHTINHPWWRGMSIYWKRNSVSRCYWSSLWAEVTFRHVLNGHFIGDVKLIITGTCWFWQLYNFKEPQEWQFS